MHFYQNLLAGLALLGLGLGQTAAGLEKLGTYEPKGFLSDYSRLKPVSRNSGELVYRYVKPGTDFSRYKKVFLDPIQVFLKADAKYKGIDPQELEALTTYFRKAIEKALGKAYPLVEQPGADVLRLRIAITDLVPNQPEASVITFAVPFLWVGEAGAGAAEGEMGSTPFVGEVTIEAEALDSRSGEQLAAYIERYVAKKYNWKQGVEKAVTDYMKAYSTWAYTKQAMDIWAQGIRDWLDKK